MGKAPKTLIEAVQYFSDKRTCVEFVKNLRWADGPVTCPGCDSEHVKELSTRQLWKCYSCKKQFSVKVGTIFEQSPISLSKWLTAMWLIANAKNGVSSCEIARSIGVCQKTAWFLMHRIREAMTNGTFLKLRGEVEVDETYVGGRDSNRHYDKKTFKIGGADKTVVFGAVERGGRVMAKVITSQKVPALQAEVMNVVELKSKLYSDELTAYKGLGKIYQHSSVNHADKQYAKKDGTHTNTIEGFWSLLKRCIKGTYVQVAPFHLDRYVTEQSFRYNLRKGDDFNRFETAVSQVTGVRLTWKRLVRQA